MGIMKKILGLLLHDEPDPEILDLIDESPPVRDVELAQGLIRIKGEDLARIVQEKRALTARVNELLEVNTRLVEERRAVDIDDRVAEFMRVVTPDQYDARMRSPGVPDPETVRLRARLIVEEAIELLEATFGPTAVDGDAPVELPHWICLSDLKRDLDTFLAFAPIHVDLPAFADACADIDYVVAGARVAFGIDGRPIAAAVHASNMAKAEGPMRADGKRLKPPGWTAPDFGALLRAQGWVPPTTDRCALCGRTDPKEAGGTGTEWIFMNDLAKVCSVACRRKLCARRTDGKHHFTSEDGPCASCERPRLDPK